MGKSISINKLCRCCMTSMDNANSVCPVCGFDKEWYSAPREHLRLDFILASRYMVGTSLSEDDYEISYIGWDLSSNRKVLIREYYPKGLVMREKSDEVAVMVEDRILAFEERVDQYLYMAEAISKLNNIRNMAKVIDFFSENHTAYMISEFPDGITAEKYLERSGGRMQPEDVIELIKPVISTVLKVHEKGIIHNAIAPYNILVTNDGDIVLMGLSPTVTFSQRDETGPWTDAYDICRTMYRLFTGQYPLKSSEENRGRGYTSNTELTRLTRLGVDISPEIEETLMKGLSPYPKERYNNVDELSERLFDGRQKGFLARDSYSTETLVKQENLMDSGRGHRRESGRTINQLKDGQCDMNDMNNMNGQRMGMGQPRMNPNNVNGQPRMNPGGMNGQPRMNPNQMNAQPRMNTTQININQRPNQMPPGQAPQQAPGQAAPVNQNTQRMNPVGNRPNQVPPQQINQAPPVAPPQGFNGAPQQRGPMNAQGAVPPMGQGMPQNVPPMGKPVMPGQPAPNAMPGIPRPGVPQQNVRPPFPNAQANPQQVMMRPGMANDPMGMVPADKNRRAPMPLGRMGKSGVNMAQGEKKIGVSTIVTFLVCAIIIGITAYNVIKLKSGNNDNESKANNTNMSSNEEDKKVSTSSEAPVATATPAPIQEYDIEWKSSVVEQYARQLTGITEGAISTKDLENVTEVRINNEGLESVDDFAHFQRVKTLNLKLNSITDLSGLAQMTCLQELDLSGNDLSATDLTPLSSISSLQKVNLQNTKVKDFAPVADVPLVIGRPCEVTVEFYYTRSNSDYDDWNLWCWGDSTGMRYDFEPGEGYVKATITMTTSVDKIGFVVRKGEWEEKDVETNRFIELKDNQSVSYITVRVNQGENDFKTEYE